VNGAYSWTGVLKFKSWNDKWQKKASLLLERAGKSIHGFWTANTN